MKPGTDCGGDKMSENDSKTCWSFPGAIELLVVALIILGVCGIGPCACDEERKHRLQTRHMETLKTQLEIQKLRQEILKRKTE